MSKRLGLFIESFPPYPVYLLLYCIYLLCTIVKRNTEVLDIEMNIPIKTTLTLRKESLLPRWVLFPKFNLGSPRGLNLYGDDNGPVGGNSGPKVAWKPAV